MRLQNGWTIDTTGRRPTRISHHGWHGLHGSENQQSSIAGAPRQEALDLHCRLHRLPPAKLEQATGIPDPVRITPKEAVERGWPYVITINRSEELERVWQKASAGD